VAQHDAGPPLALSDISRQEQIARKLDALAVEGYGLRHCFPLRMRDAARLASDARGERQHLPSILETP
jgi:hypothetical protein